MSFEIIEQLSTPSEAALLRQEVEALQASLFRVKENSFEETLKTSVRAWVADWIRNTLEKEKTDKEKFLNELKEFLVKLPTVHVDVGFEPTQQNVSAIVAWCKAQVQKDIVVDLQYKPEIVAGAVVSFHGKYFDGSLRQAFEEKAHKTIEEGLGIKAVQS